MVDRAVASGSSGQTPPVELARSLLRDAGIRAELESWSLLGVSTSRVWALSAVGRRYVLRERLDNDAQLARKELYLSGLLRQHGVPAPEVLALAEGEHPATLSTLLPGVRLDQAIAQLGATDLDQAWRATGAALRLAHEIVLPEAGEIVAGHIEPFAGGWNRWLLEDLAGDLRWIRERLGGRRVAQARLEQLADSAVAVLAAAPVRLLHNDALPQNIIVAPGPEGWRCSGWLDWEFARAGDPQWDLGALDFRPAGLVPPSFYAGYGAQPPEPQASIYELLQATWRLRVELEHGSRWDWPPHQARLAYFARLPELLDRIAAA